MESTAENVTENKLLFDRKYECIHCGEKFTTKKIRLSKLALDRRDPDYCCYYKQGNPYLYEMNFCPHCGFAYTDNFTPPNPAQREILKRTYLAKVEPLDFSGERSNSDAVKTYKLGLVCASLTNQSAAIIAGILMRLAWINRFDGNKEEEEKHLQKALKSYEFLYLNDNTPGQKKMSKHQILYLMGELCGRIGRITEAQQWFSKLFMERNVEPALDKMARDRWQDFKAAM